MGVFGVIKKRLCRVVFQHFTTYNYHPGDSGYPLRIWLLTPFRVVVECSIGLFNSRWRCLDKSGGILLYEPEKVCAITRACAVLHNIAQRHRIPAPASLLPDDMDAHAANEDHAPRTVELREQVMGCLWTGKTQNIRTSAVNLPMASVISLCDCSTASVRTRAEGTPRMEPDEWSMRWRLTQGHWVRWSLRPLVHGGLLASGALPSGTSRLHVPEK